MQNARNKIQIKRIPNVFLAGVLLILDQGVKYLFSGSDRYFCNAGGPWGMAADNDVLISVMVVILVAAGCWTWGKECHSFGGGNPENLTGERMNGCEVCTHSFAETTTQQRTLVFIFAGGLSNLIDRIVFGCVRDFALVSWFPAFNPADVFLTIGVAILFVFLPLSKNTLLFKRVW